MSEQGSPEIDTADIQEYILHLNDDTKWPAEYYKAVIRYALAHAQDRELKPPQEIHYTRCAQKYRGK